MVRIKGPAQVRLAYARCKQGTKKTLSFYTQGYLMMTVFSRKHVGVLYLLVKIHKKPSKVETRRVKNKYYRNGSCQIKVFFCWTLRSAPPYEAVGYGIVAKPKRRGLISG
jgi:hypothetical protein